MIEYLEGNIIDFETDLLVNASNGIGWMGGIIGRFFPLRGVSESIHFADHTIEKEAKNICKNYRLNLGDIFITSAGSLKFDKGILHAITMIKPGEKSNIHTIKKCLYNISLFCFENEISSASIPLLGTGTGGVEKEIVLNEFYENLNWHPTNFKVIQYTN